MSNTSFKVYIHIEEYDEDRGDGVGEVDPGFGCAATFPTQDAAIAYARMLRNTEEEEVHELDFGKFGDGEKIGMTRHEAAALVGDGAITLKDRAHVYSYALPHQDRRKTERVRRRLVG